MFSFFKGFFDTNNFFGFSIADTSYEPIAHNVTQLIHKLLTDNPNKLTEINLSDEKDN